VGDIYYLVGDTASTATTVPQHAITLPSFLSGKGTSYMVLFGTGKRGGWRERGEGREGETTVACVQRGLKAGEGTKVSTILQGFRMNRRKETGENG
jgi:hypothetical protein